MPPPLTEVCVESFEEVVAACRAGADRIELCKDLSVGGLTPDFDLVAEVLEYCHRYDVNVFAMVRCRDGDFVYSESEKLRMIADTVTLRDMGIHGVVVGALMDDRSIDFQFISDLRRKIPQIPITFHKAFDSTVEDIAVLMNRLHSLGVKRVLSSGRSKNAEDGVESLKVMVSLCEPIVVMAGSVRSHNVVALVRATGATEIHSRSPGICEALQKTSVYS